ncbi:MAG: DUF1284 domain-containing protein [Proteobacteria bacterium]|nr:DUF1284 domain-containing protein [Pseudomonadota bacterium]
MGKAAFRPHHIFCKRFLKGDFPDRGQEYQEVSNRIRHVIEAEDEFSIEVREGIDELCRVCPNCRDERCQSHQGNEEGVRKWDSIILKGLGSAYGETRTSKGWRMLIAEKAPLAFCERRCPWKSSCGVFELG